MLLRITQLSVWLGIPLAISVQWYSETPIGPHWFMVVGLAFYSIAAYILILCKRHELAVGVFLWCMLAVVLIQCTLINGIRTPAAVSLPIILMLCGWLRGPRHAYAMGTVVLSALTAMCLLEPRFWPIQQQRPAFAYWANYSFGSVVGTMLAVHIAHNLRRQYQRMRWTEDELQHRIEELQTTQEKFATLFRFSPAPVSVTLIKDGTYHDVNPAWERISGWRRDEVLGKTSGELRIWVGENDRDVWVGELLAKGRIENRLVSFRLRSGEIREYFSNAEIFDYDGAPCIFASFIDVTEQRAAEARLRELNAKLEERVAQRTNLLEAANADLSATVSLLQRTQEELVRSETLASLGALVAGVAHELNTPLGSAVLISSTLNEDISRLKHELADGALRKSTLTRFVDDADKACVLLGSSLQRARDLVNSFKTVAMDQSSERRRSFDLAEILDDVLQTLRPSFKHRPIHVESTLTPGLRMDSFPGPICQVLSNLVQNAIMHGLDHPNGGTITVSCQALDEERVHIEVCDDGTGISAEHLPRIFDPFFTTRLGRGGSGLGLSIVHSLVNTTLGGSITVSSEQGRGARFSVILPRQAPNQG